MSRYLPLWSLVTLLQISTIGHAQDASIEFKSGVRVEVQKPSCTDDGKISGLTLRVYSVTGKLEALKVDSIVGTGDETWKERARCSTSAPDYAIWRTSNASRCDFAWYSDQVPVFPIEISFKQPRPLSKKNTVALKLRGFLAHNGQVETKRVTLTVPTTTRTCLFSFTLGGLGIGHDGWRPSKSELATLGKLAKKYNKPVPETSSLIERGARLQRVASKNPNFITQSVITSLPSLAYCYSRDMVAHHPYSISEFTIERRGKSPTQVWFKGPPGFVNECIVSEVKFWRWKMPPSSSVTFSINYGGPETPVLRESVHGKNIPLYTSGLSVDVPRGMRMRVMSGHLVDVISNNRMSINVSANESDAANASAWWNENSSVYGATLEKKVDRADGYELLFRRGEGKKSKHSVRVVRVIDGVRFSCQMMDRDKRAQRQALRICQTLRATR